MLSITDFYKYQQFTVSHQKVQLVNATALIAMNGLQAI